MIDDFIFNFFFPNILSLLILMGSENDPIAALSHTTTARRLKFLHTHKHIRTEREKIHTRTIFCNGAVSLSISLF